MSEEMVYKPGTKTPASGIYECDCGGSHTCSSTDVKGHTLPPLPADCTGTGWKLNTPAHPE